MSTSFPICDSACTKYVRGECDLESGDLSYTRECDIEGCLLEYIEVNACPTWSGWEGFVGDCVGNKRAVRRTCTSGKDVPGLVDAEYLGDQGCPGEDTKEMDCVPNVYSDTCSCEGSVGTLTWSCAPGENLHPEDVCEDKANEDCSYFCPLWTAWGQWTAFFPECVDELDVDNPDTIFNDLDKHMPKRIRERECRFSDGTLAYANHESGNCPASDKAETERQTIDDYTKCVSPFEDVEIDKEVQVETKVIVDFQVEIDEEWTPELNDTESEEFTDLAEIYILCFLEALKAVEEVEGTSKIQFATVRVVRFILIEEDFVAFRQRRSVARNRIKAEFETVYDIIAAKDDEKETNIKESERIKIDLDLAQQVSTQVRKTIEEEIIVTEVGDHKAGELNFLRIPEAAEIVTTVNYEKKVLARYSDYFVKDCDCETGETYDYNECIATERYAKCVYGDDKILEEQGVCFCVAWSSWTELDICGDCDSSYQNCKQTFERNCQPAEHYRDEDSDKWSPNTRFSCEGNEIKKEPCTGIYGKWLSWEPCDKTCVNFDEQSTRFRERNCNDTLSEEKCDVAKSKEMRFCQLPLCEKCANFEKPCASLNEKCADVDGTMTCLCKSPFVQDDFGDCKNSTKSTTSQQLITKIWVPIVSLVAFALAMVLVVLLIRYFKRRKKCKELTEEKKRRTARIKNLNYDKPYEEKSYETPYKNHIYNEYNPSSEDDRQSVIYETYNSE